MDEAERRDVEKSRIPPKTKLRNSDVEEHIIEILNLDAKPRELMDYRRRFRRTFE